MIVREVTTIMNAASFYRNDVHSQSGIEPVDNTEQVPTKKAKSSLFASYERRRQEGQQPDSSITSLSPITVATSFVEKMVCIASSQEGAGPQAWKLAQKTEHYNIMRPLLEKIFCVPATSAPVERVFSHSGIIMKPNRARLSDELLSALVFIKCNNSNNVAEESEL
jgi:hypothetical protein